MSIFNFRRGRPASDKPAASKAAPESVELIRRRARQRLIGSAVLVLIGVVGFPLLFETQPRPVPVDIPIEIPSRASVKPASPIAPLVRQEPQAAPAVPAEAAAPAAAAPVVAAQASLQDKEEIVDARPEPKPEPQPPSQAKPESRPEPKLAKPEERPRADDGQRARALLEGAAAKPEAPDGRIVVQVGAFADAAKARETRQKLEKAGLKTYTQVAETKDGSRIRVRVGPFASKAEAEKAATKIKSLNLPAAILVL